MGKEIDSTIDPAAKGPEPATSAKNTSPAADSGPGTGTGTGATAATRARTRKKPVVAADLVAQQPEIVSITIPEPAPEPAAAPKRSHKRKTPAAPDLSQLENNITYVAAAGFSMVGLATKQPDIWAVRPEELDQISKPAARLVERAGQLETSNKYADYALLLGALALVVLPRLILTKTLAAPKQEVIPQNVRTNDSGPRNPDREATAPISNDSQNPINALYEIN